MSGGFTPWSRFRNPLREQPDFAVPPEVAAEIDELITHYPKKRSASLMLLHTVQERFGYVFTAGRWGWICGQAGAATNQRL